MDTKVRSDLAMVLYCLQFRKCLPAGDEVGRHFDATLGHMSRGELGGIAASVRWAAEHEEFDLVGVLDDRIHTNQELQAYIVQLARYLCSRVEAQPDQQF